MEQFYSQLLMVVVGIYATMTTGFIGWMALISWRLSNQVAAFEVKFEEVAKDMGQMAKDVSELRKYDVLLATHATQINGLDRRVTNLEHTGHRRQAL